MIKFAHVPFNCFRFVKRPTKKELTEEQRKECANRLKLARERKEKQNG